MEEDMKTAPSVLGSAVPLHTPGPWRVDPNKPGIVRTNDDPTSGILVGLAANAKLVAAAPDLLASLKECVVWYARREADGSDAMLPIDEQPHEIRNALLVIAKAEGWS